MGFPRPSPGSTFLRIGAVGWAEQREAHKSSHLLDGGQEPIAAATPDKGPHLFRFARRLRVAADQIIGISRRTAEPRDVVGRAPPQIGGGVLQVALFPAFADLALQQADIRTHLLDALPRSPA